MNARAGSADAALAPSQASSPARSLARATAMLAAALALAGCAPPPMFTHAPGPREAMDLPAQAVGMWGKEGRDEGSRARIVRTGKGSLRLDIFNTRPAEAADAPMPPLNGRTARFAGRDWLVLDVARWDYGRQERADMNGFLLIAFAFEGPNRVCLKVPASAAIAAAVEADELKGTVKPERNNKAVLVSSPATQWLSWWSRHVDAVAMSEDSLCLRRLPDDATGPPVSNE